MTIGTIKIPKSAEMPQITFLFIRYMIICSYSAHTLFITLKEYVKNPNVKDE